MVPSDRIDAEGVQSPVEIWPSLNADFIWRSQSQGELTVKGPLIPGQSYRFRLREDERDLTGSPLPAAASSFEMTAPPLRVVEEGYGERTSLNASPQVPIEFNYPLPFRRRQGRLVPRSSQPAEVSLPKFCLTCRRPVGRRTGRRGNGRSGGGLRISCRPLQPLPVGRRYDLVVDRVHDVNGGRTLPYPQVSRLA